MPIFFPLQAVYLKDIAEIKDTIKEKESYARLDGKNVVTLNIIKRAGENLINTADKVKAAVPSLNWSYQHLVRKERTTTRNLTRFQ